MLPTSSPSSRRRRLQARGRAQAASAGRQPAERPCGPACKAAQPAAATRQPCCAAPAAGARARRLGVGAVPRYVAFLSTLHKKQQAWMDASLRARRLPAAHAGHHPAAQPGGSSSRPCSTQRCRPAGSRMGAAPCSKARGRLHHQAAHWGSPALGAPPRRTAGVRKHCAEGQRLRPRPRAVQQPQSRCSSDTGDSMRCNAPPAQPETEPPPTLKHSPGPRRSGAGMACCSRSRLRSRGGRSSRYPPPSRRCPGLRLRPGGPPPSRRSPGLRLRVRGPPPSRRSSRRGLRLRSRRSERPSRGRSSRRLRSGDRRLRRGASRERDGQADRLQASQNSLIHAVQLLRQQCHDQDSRTVPSAVAQPRTGRARAAAPCSCSCRAAAPGFCCGFCTTAGAGGGVGSAGEGGRGTTAGLRSPAAARHCV